MTEPVLTQVREPDEILLGFARALRAAGVPVTHDRTQGYLAAVAMVGLDDAAASYVAGRATLCASPDDLARYDQVHEAYFNGRDGLPRARPSEANLPSFAGLPEAEGEGPGDGETDDPVVRAMASDTEVLRHRDVASLSAAEKARLARMFTTLRPRPPRRRTARHQRWHRGTLDAPRTLRASLRHLGEPAEIAWRRRGNKPRRVVLLVDVSGSMSGYADALLRLAHRFTQGSAAGGGSSRRSPSAPGSPMSLGPCGARTPSARWSRPARPSPTGRAGPGWGRRSRSSWTAGGSAASPAARWWSCSATAGSGATRPSWPSR